MKHSFTARKGTIQGSVTGSFSLPSGAEVFDLEAWRKSDLFRATDSAEAIGKVIAASVAADQAIKIQAVLRKNARTQADADRELAAYFATGSLQATYVPADVFKTFSKAQLATLEAQGTIILPEPEEK